MTNCPTCRKPFVSICSRHQQFNDDCDICAARVCIECVIEPAYGSGPTLVGEFPDIKATEMVSTMYLPIAFPGTDIRIPPNLRWVDPLVYAVIKSGEIKGDDYLYLTAKRGYATPENPLNRPGWHTDGFGTEDTNWVWMSRWGSRIAVHPFHSISCDHMESMRQFDEQARTTETLEERCLYRLDPYVVHATPLLTESGERTFVKISRSPHRYNLEGNAHNYLFDYEWEMYPRSVARNDPAQYGRDYYLPISENEPLTYDHDMVY